MGKLAFVQHASPVNASTHIVTKPKVKLPPPPLKKIAWLFSAKYRPQLWRLGPFLALHDLGRLAQVNEATNEHMMAYFQSPLNMSVHAIPFK